jgi:hypothetical protein
VVVSPCARTFSVASSALLLRDGWDLTLRLKIMIFGLHLAVNRDEILAELLVMLESVA